MEIVFTTLLQSKLVLFMSQMNPVQNCDIVEIPRLSSVMSWVRTRQWPYISLFSNMLQAVSCALIFDLADGGDTFL
jgi:hypothetical protein